jgi:hypothetical protein
MLAGGIRRLKLFSRLTRLLLERLPGLEFLTGYELKAALLLMWTVGRTQVVVL